MRFLSLYTAKTMNGPPSAEHMAAMGRLIEEMIEGRHADRDRPARPRRDRRL
jgi:hypothetical protein